MFTENGKEAALKLIEAEVLQGVAFVEQEMGRRFGNPSDPLLLSVRSGARASMPGMMDTILNLGLTDEAVVGLARKAGNQRFAWDSYRRFVQMYGDVVMGLKPVSKEDHDRFEVIIDMIKAKRGVQLDTELDTGDLKELVARFKALIRARIGRDFSTDPWEQLWGAVVAVFESWNNERACVYSVRPAIEIGVCGEHGGDPASVAFFHRAGLDYVSCSPYRVPIARLAATQAAIGG